MSALLQEYETAHAVGLACYTVKAGRASTSTSLAMALFHPWRGAPVSSFA